MRLSAFDVDDESDAARFVFELRVVKALLWRGTAPPGLVATTLHTVHSQEITISDRFNKNFCILYRNARTMQYWIWEILLISTGIADQGALVRHLINPKLPVRYLPTPCTLAEIRAIARPTPLLRST